MTIHEQTTAQPKRDAYIYSGEDPYVGLSEGDRVEVLRFGRWRRATVVEKLVWPKEWKNVADYLRAPLGIRVAFDDAQPRAEGSRQMPRGLSPYDADCVREAAHAGGAA